MVTDRSAAHRFEGVEALYAEPLLALVRALPEAGLLEGAGAGPVVERTSKLCGSAVRLNVRLDAAGRVVAVGAVVEACALGRAAASVVLQAGVGCDLAAAEDAYQRLRALLLEGALFPDGHRFEALNALVAARAHPHRFASVLLAVDAFRTAVAITLYAGLRP